MKRITATVLCFMLALSMVGCSSRSKGTVPDDAAYLVTYSSIQKRDGGYYYVNADGDILNKGTKLKMQDLSRYEVKNDRVILSGERRNNTLLFDRNSSVPDTDLVFLNNPGYTGVTAVASDGDNVLGIMNGGFRDGVYKNVYVLQNLSGEVIKQYPLEIFAHKALYSENKTVIAGAYIESAESALISIAELLDCTDENTKTYKYDEYKGFWDAVLCGDVIYCLAERKNGSRDTVVMVDANDYSVVAESCLNDVLVNLFVYNDSVYAVGNTGLYSITSLNGGAELTVGFNEDVLSNDSYAYSAYELDGKAYIFLRYSQRQKENGSYVYGNMVRVDLESTVMDVVQIKSAAGNRADTLFIIPASFVRK